MTQEQKEYAASLWKSIVRAGEELRGREMPRLQREDFFLYKETGNRLVYERAYFGRRKYLTVFGILSEYGGAQKDIDELVYVLGEVCEEPLWALPAHVDFAHVDRNTIDLFAAETAQSMMELMVILEEKLPQETQSKVVTEVLRRVLLPFVTSAVPYSWWEQDGCNWAAVCAGSIGMAALYLQKWMDLGGSVPALADLPEGWQEAIRRRACDALDCYLGGMEEDGACTEGLGYYAYGMSYYTAYAELLYQETHGEIDLMHKPKCEQIALFPQKCFFKGASISFSDGSAHESFLPGLTAYLHHCYPSVVAPDYSLARHFDEDACYRWLTNERNLRWLERYGAELPSAGERGEWQYHLLPDAQWLICTDAHGNGCAAKGGHNAEQHNHNDVGSFLCTYHGEQLLADLGAGEYTKDYFNENRYTILCNRSLGHSVPLINGTEQCAGREYAADSFIWDGTRHTLTISFADAYAAGLLNTLTRCIHILNEDGTLALHVVDTFRPSAATTSITEQLVTQYPVLLQDNTAYIQGHAATLRVTVTTPTAIPIITRVIESHANHQGAPEPVYLLRWTVPFSQGQDSVCEIDISC